MKALSARHCQLQQPAALAETIHRCSPAHPQRKPSASRPVPSPSAGLVRSQPEGAQLASYFLRFVNESGAQEPTQNRSPSHLMPPNVAVAAQLDALQRNDYPETDAGVQVAYRFTKPAGCEQMTVGQAFPSRARSWHAKEEWLGYSGFRDMIHTTPYDMLLGSDHWEVISGMKFPSKRHSNSAVQAVRLFNRPRHAHDDCSSLREYTFTFCLQRIDTGPYKGCWMTVGVRCGDYANI